MNTKDSAKHSMRVRRFEISPEAFPMQFTKGMKFKVEEGIPEGATFRGFAVDPMRNLLVVFVEHESFDEIPVAGEPPLDTISIRYYPKDGIIHSARDAQYDL